MRTLIKAIVLSVLIMGFPSTVRADVEDGTIIDSSIVVPLMAWVQREMGVTVPFPPQVIASRSRFSIILRRMSGAYAGRPQSAYIPGTVVMDNTVWDPKEATQISLLVHELVHHVQMFIPSSYWPCSAAKESQAYDLQNKWLQQRGHYPFVHAAWINRVSACEDRSATVYLAER